MNKFFNEMVTINMIIKNKRKGMTLIEVILSVALLAIIAISFLPMFTAGFKFIINNGNEVQDMYLNQNSIEEKIAVGTKNGTSNLTIRFNGTEIKEIKVLGDYFTFDSYNLFISNK